MGMGIGTFLPNSAIIKRRYRWTLQFEAGTILGADAPAIKPIFITIAARPNLTIEETELNFLNEKDYIAAKPTWDPLNVTILDFGKQGGNGADQAILDWIRLTYQFGNPESSGEMSDPVGFARRDALLFMYNGVGEIVEKWTLFGCWVQAANWGDLDYSSTENATIELTIRFQNADCKLLPSTGRIGQPSTNSIASFEGNRARNFESNSLPATA
jgi:hypothetical protein